MDDKDIDRIEEIINKAKPISLIDEGLSPEEIMEELFGEFEWKCWKRAILNTDVIVKGQDRRFW